MKIKLSLFTTLSLILILAGCSSTKKNTPNIFSGSFNNSTTGSSTTLNDSKTIINGEINTKKILTKLSEIGAGMISECEYKSDLYFSVDFNNLNLPTKIIDKQGNITATCDYKIESKNKLAPICNNLQKCKLIYVATNNVRGYNPVDKYSISQ